ncbi:MAG TPA: hypothetical protein VMW87_16270 [Spirochaetia bacterium]|nr:hypothetical protein [Spirochaetia bacterium]
MKPVKVTAIAAVVVVVIIVFVAILRFGGPRNISGTYELFVANKDTGTVVVVKEIGESYEFNMRGTGNLEMSFTTPKARNNRYLLESASGGKAFARYQVEATGKGLQGTAMVLPIGSVDVFFRKVK